MTHLKTNPFFKLRTNCHWVLWLGNKFYSETWFVEMCTELAETKEWYSFMLISHNTFILCWKQRVLFMSRKAWGRYMGLREVNLTACLLEHGRKENLCLWEQTRLWLFTTFWILNETESMALTQNKTRGYILSFFRIVFTSKKILLWVWISFLNWNME